MANFEKLRAKLEAITKNAANAKSVSVGWSPENSYSEARGGLFVAKVAAINEFGGTIEIPEHVVTLNRSVNEKTGEFKRGGRFVKNANFQTTSIVPAHSVTIPARPFFRTLVVAKKSEWVYRMAIAAFETHYDLHKTLDIVGESVTNDLKRAIRDFKSPGNAASTIARKGFDDPLIEDGVMLNTAHHWVET